ncbi:MAG: hypothetical protein IPM92_09770 [Saprospiraceae bacterium]|nr:hypothetical protein [Saprospiraceae bacterium]
MTIQSILGRGWLELVGSNCRYDAVHTIPYFQNQAASLENTGHQIGGSDSWVLYNQLILLNNAHKGIPFIKHPII